MITELLEKKPIPDFLIRFKIRNLLKQRQNQIGLPNIENEVLFKKNFIEDLKKMPIALNTKEANEQHYEVPSDFYKIVLGKNLKYSSGFWNENTVSLDESE